LHLNMRTSNGLQRSVEGLSYRVQQIHNIPMGFVLGCCLGRPPPARACTNRGIWCQNLQRAESEPQGLVCCPAKCAHGRSSNGKRNTATTHKYQPPRASVRRQPKPLPVGVMGRNIEDTQPLPPHSCPKHPKTAPRPVGPPPQGSIRPTGILACAH
jgi:hypothetical protein